MPRLCILWCCLFFVRRSHTLEATILIGLNTCVPDLFNSHCYCRGVLNIPQFSDSKQVPELFPIKIRDAKLTHPEIPIWIKLILFNSPNDTMESLYEEEKQEQYVRLVKTASNPYRQAILMSGKELCQPTAALYFRMDDITLFDISRLPRGWACSASIKT